MTAIFAHDGENDSGRRLVVSFYFTVLAIASTGRGLHEINDYDICDTVVQRMPRSFIIYPSSDTTPSYSQEAEFEGGEWKPGTETSILPPRGCQLT